MQNYVSGGNDDKELVFEYTVQKAMKELFSLKG